MKGRGLYLFLEEVFFGIWEIVGVGVFSYGNYKYVFLEGRLGSNFSIEKLMFCLVFFCFFICFCSCLFI